MKSESISIKACTEQDIDVLCHIENECFSCPWTRIAFSDFFGNNLSLCLAAYIGEEIAGYVGAYIIADICEITNIATLPSFRNRNVATSLMNKLIMTCYERHAERIILEVRESNIPAISFYKKIGFYEVGVRKGYYKNPKEDAILMDYRIIGENQ